MPPTTITEEQKQKMAEGRAAQYQWRRDHPEEWAAQKAAAEQEKALKLFRSQKTEARIQAKKVARQKETKPVDEFSEELEQDAPDTPAFPQVDAEVAAIQAYETSRRPPKRTLPQAPPQEPDPYVEADKRAQLLIAQEYEQRQREAARRRGVEPPPGARQQPIPVIVSPRDYHPDLSAEGKEFVQPGWIPRWMRRVDGWNRPTATPVRMAEFKALGGRPVLDADGKPITGMLGDLWEIPGEQYAIRSMHAAPAGAYDRQYHTNQAQAELESFNSQAGREVARFVGEGATIDPNPGDFPG